MPAYPETGMPWGTCGSCGFVFPANQLHRHRRYGWRCFAPNVWGTDCWPGTIIRDEIRVIPRKNEGIRRTTAPLAVEDDGIDTYLSDETAFNFLDQADQRTAYEMVVGGTFLTFESLGEWRTLDIEKPTGGWVLPDGANRIWIRNGSLEFGTRFKGLPLGFTDMPAHAGLAVVGGSLQYTA